MKSTAPRMTREQNMSLDDILANRSPQENQDGRFSIETDEELFTEIKLFLDNNNISVNAVNQEGETILMKVAQHGNDEIVKYLIDHDADVNAVDDQGMTAFTKATFNQHNKSAKIMRVLIDSGIDISAVEKQGFSSLQRVMGRYSSDETQDTHLQKAEILNEMVTKLVIGYRSTEPKAQRLFRDLTEKMYDENLIKYLDRETAILVAVAMPTNMATKVIYEFNAKDNVRPIGMVGEGGMVDVLKDLREKLDPVFEGKKINAMSAIYDLLKDDHFKNIARFYAPSEKHLLKTFPEDLMIEISNSFGGSFSDKEGINPADVSRVVHQFLEEKSNRKSSASVDIDTGPKIKLMERTELTEEEVKILQDKIRNDGVEETISFLKDNHINCNAADKQGTTILMMVVLNAGSPEMFKVLMDKGANSNAVNMTGNTVAHYAAMKCRADLLTIAYSVAPNLSKEAWAPSSYVKNTEVVNKVVTELVISHGIETKKDAKPQARILYEELTDQSASILQHLDREAMMLVAIAMPEEHKALTNKMIDAFNERDNTKPISRIGERGEVDVLRALRKKLDPLFKDKGITAMSVIATLLKDQHLSLCMSSPPEPNLIKDMNVILQSDDSYLPEKYRIDVPAVSSTVEKFLKEGPSSIVRLKIYGTDYQHHLWVDLNNPKLFFK